MLSTRRILALALLPVLFVQCQEVPPTATPFVYVSADRTEVSRRPSDECAFRYSIVNTYARLDNDGQREAIRAGFARWQEVDPNLGFLEFAATNRASLLVRFVDPQAMPVQSVTAPVGLLRGSVGIASALRRETNGTHSLLLNNAFDWSRNALIKAVAYQAGLFLGLATSTETSSLMFPFFGSQSVAASSADSVLVNRLYASPCRGLAADYLPLSLKVNGLVTKTIRLDKPGTVVIRASGLLTVGFFVGISGPEGTEGLGGTAIPQYNIVPGMLHAALMYRIDTEQNWHYWKGEPTFKTNDRRYVDLTFAVNDNNLTDNSGAYDVVVDYQ